MSITEKDGKWFFDFYPEGKPKGKLSKRVRKTFATKGEALDYEHYILENLDNKPWLDGKEDRRTLRQLIYMRFDEHSITLDDGEKRKSAMEYACECTGGTNRARIRYHNAFSV